MANLKIPRGRESDKNKNKQYDKNPLPINYAQTTGQGEQEGY